MDTITEAASSEAEEVNQEEDGRGPSEAEAVMTADKPSTEPKGEAPEGPQASKELGEPQALETKAEAPEGGEETYRAATPVSDKNTVDDATQTAKHMPSRSENAGEDAVQTANQAKTESSTAESETVNRTPQAHYNEAFVLDDLDGQSVEV